MIVFILYCVLYVTLSCFYFSDSTMEANTRTGVKVHGPQRYASRCLSEERMIEVLFPDFVWKVCRKCYISVGYFVLILWQTDNSKREILKQSCKNLFIWTELPIIWLIIGSDIFNIELRSQWSISNTRYCAQHLKLPHRKRLKFWI